MIHFSRMADFGVLLLGHFTQHEDGWASTSTLAETYHLPRAVVANLLKTFCTAGILRSRRGQHGGYCLARSAKDISLLEVLRLVEGPVRLIECAAADLAATCEYEDVCPSRSPMLTVNQRVVALLDGISLADLMSNPVSGTATGHLVGDI